MPVIPVISSQFSAVQLTEDALKKFDGQEIKLYQLKTINEALEYLPIEMPEMAIVNFSDPRIDAFNLLATLMSDAWLLHAGIIGFCQTNNEIERLESFKGANLIIALGYEDIAAYLPKIFSIIFNNRRILFQREISTDFVKNICGSFKLDNDLHEVKCYVNLICNFLYNSNRLKLDQKYDLKLALTELMINAIEHGNCEISYEEKSDWLEKWFDISELITQKNRDPVINKRKITFEYTLNKTKGTFLIADEGMGFDWTNVKDVTQQENIFELHGRGILITRALVHNLTFNSKGNEVTFDVPFEDSSTELVPGIFENIPVKEVKKGDIIFNEGEPGDFLYYIVKGSYEVILNKGAFTTLTPDDIFMGEMSFLLNNFRSATIRAATDGKLIGISKKDFVEAIRLKPHYALFICRLLAQRILRSDSK